MRQYREERDVALRQRDDAIEKFTAASKGFREMAERHADSERRMAAMADEHARAHEELTSAGFVEGGSLVNRAAAAGESMRRVLGELGQAKEQAAEANKMQGQWLMVSRLADEESGRLSKLLDGAAKIVGVSTDELVDRVNSTQEDQRLQRGGER